MTAHLPTGRDTLYDSPLPAADFRFDERTAAVFPDMIHRSIPGYAALLQMTAAVAADFLKAGSHIYDLGCSLGGVSLALASLLPSGACITAVDISSAMIDRFQAYLAGAGISAITVQQADITAIELAPADLIVLNFVLQFIPPESRAAVLENIYRALPSGGALLIAEKIRPDNPRMTVWHETFKRLQGYSDMAIAQKRESLENVMKTDSLTLLRQRLLKAGFNTVEPYFQGLSFVAFAAVKA